MTDVTDAIVKDVQSLAISSEIVEVYELQVNQDPDQYIYFSGTYYDDTTSTKIKMRDQKSPYEIREYHVIPASLTGLEFKSGGPLPQPKLKIANVLRTDDNTSLAGVLENAKYEDILGFKFYRRRTLKKYLYNVDTSSEPPIEFPADMYYLDRIDAENPVEVTFTLVSPFDLSGVTLPRRTIIGNMCPWEYQGAANNLNNWEKRGGCTWNTESKVFVNGLEHRTFVNVDDEYVVPSTLSFTDDPGSGTRVIDTYYQTDTSAITKINWGGGQADALAVSDGNKWHAATAATTDPADNSTDWRRLRTFANYTRANAVNVYIESKFNSYVLDGQIESISISNNGSSYTSVPAVTIDAPDIGTTNGVRATGTALVEDGAVTGIVIDEPGHGYVAGETVTVTIASNATATNPTVVTRLWQAKKESQTGTTNRIDPGFNSYWTRGDVCGKKITSCKMRYGYNPILTLSYDNQTANFTTYKQLTGGTSKATATISAAPSDQSGDTGTLTLTNLVGTFIDDETITDDNSSAGSARVNGSAGGAVTSKGKVALRTLDNTMGLPHGGFPTARRMGGK
jgi:lambda family phage minor tail protein L